MVRNTCNASSLRPFDIKNLGLSGRKMNAIPLSTLGKAQIARNICHDLSAWIKTLFQRLYTCRYRLEGRRLPNSWHLIPVRLVSTAVVNQKKRPPSLYSCHFVVYARSRYRQRHLLVGYAFYRKKKLTNKTANLKCPRFGYNEPCNCCKQMLID